uniref:Uncharacterized protein LOC104229267 isoform X1 n=2 Tax=Nicotiana sylvestris TaxID=4096 RepID=A0A1U7WS94_NICSY|nr:PREDICTED: uncharacterized protein LOC104229267 isoform X1 [Nicotiana sylvestris]
MRINLAIVGIGEPLEERKHSSGEGEGLPAFGLKNYNNKREMLLQGDGAQSKAKWDRGSGAGASSDPSASVVPDSRKMVSPPLSPSFSVDSTSRDTRNRGSHTPSDCASAGVDPFRAGVTRLADVRSAFEEAQRLHFMAFDKLKSGLLRCEARLWKALDEERSLRLLCDEKEVELVHLRYLLSRSLNYKNYLKEQL